MLGLFEQLRKRICNLDSSVREEFKKIYIAYKTTTNFVDIVPQKSRLRLSLNMVFNEIHDPKAKGSVELNSQVKGQRRAEKNTLFFSALFVVSAIFTIIITEKI
ncbi:DUF5655 domain-containing protein [Peribacillus loiseleuriae]|uniref:DUF5655 domain-containing protein n=1 Tax=Peribacillus loiseleuriae TaxID=1679170 RepID=UPI00382A92D6